MLLCSTGLIFNFDYIINLLQRLIFIQSTKCLYVKCFPLFQCVTHVIVWKLQKNTEVVFLDRSILKWWSIKCFSSEIGLCSNVTHF